MQQPCSRAALSVDATSNSVQIRQPASMLPGVPIFYQQESAQPGSAPRGAFTAEGLPFRKVFSPAANHLRGQDRLLPMATVQRLMLAELPNDAKISHDARLIMQEMVSEWICLTASEANDISIAGGNRAITQEDHRSALEALGVLLLSQRSTLCLPSDTCLCTARRF